MPHSEKDTVVCPNSNDVIQTKITGHMENHEQKCKECCTQWEKPYYTEQT